MNENPKNGSHLTYQERKQIKNLIDEGKSLTQAAIALGRGRNTVIFEVRRNGCAENYDPLAAHNAYISRKKESDEQRRINAKRGKDHYTSMKQRIEILEMQMEILIDTIKEKSERITDLK